MERREIMSASAKPDRLPRRDPDPIPDGEACPECRRAQGHALDCCRRCETPAWKPDPMRQVTENFQAWELWRSDTAARLGIDNTPGGREFASARILTRHVLQPVRDEFGAFSPTNVYRCQELERAIKRKPAEWVSKSQHVLGQAADFRIVGVDLLAIARWLAERLNFDQLILEHYDPTTNAGWIHVSWTSHDDNRGEILRVRMVAGEEVWERGLP